MTTQTESRPTQQRITTSEPEHSQLSRIGALGVSELNHLVQTVIEKDRSNFWVWHALSTLYADQDDLRGAMEVFEQEFSKSPSNLAIAMELMSLYAALSNYEKAIEYWRKPLWGLDQVQKVLVSPKDPRILGIIHNFKSKEKSLELYIPIEMLSDLFQPKAKNKRQLRLH
jgi:tetratricopeptide (TPR) repeat protein